MHIPYAHALARRVPASAVRVRRDFPTLLSLIAASANLHQAQRPCTADDAVIATLDDYRVVRELVCEALSSAQQDDVTPRQHQVAEAVAELRRDPAWQNAGVSLSAVDWHLHMDMDKGNLSRHLAALVTKCYVRNLESRKGVAAAYVPGKPLPAPQEALPRVEALEDAMRQGLEAGNAVDEKTGDQYGWTE